jgi:hypothetical protein
MVTLSSIPQGTVSINAPERAESNAIPTGKKARERINAVTTKAALPSTDKRLFQGTGFFPKALPTIVEAESPAAKAATPPAAAMDGKTRTVIPTDTP